VGSLYREVLWKGRPVIYVVQILSDPKDNLIPAELANGDFEFHKMLGDCPHTTLQPPPGTHPME
jgi:hypothetical protein